MLLFKKKFLDAIRRGEKTQTIRLWVRPRFKSGQRSYIPGVGYISIQLVEPVELDDLTDEDAQPDGFATADALRAEIEAIYSQYPDRGQRAYRIKFALAPNEKKRNADSRRKSFRSESASGRTHKSGDGIASSNKGPPPASTAMPLTLPPTSRGRLPRTSLPADGFLLTYRRRNSANP